MLELRDVTFSYDDAGPTLKDVDLVLPDGELHLVCGRTGSGKSTLLGLFNGLVPHFSGGLLEGDVLVDGASIIGTPPRELAHLVGYDDVQTVCAAALKLLPLDPGSVVGWVVAALPAVEAMATRVSSVAEVDDLPATTHPLIEVWAQAHAATTRRLFHA